MSISDQQIFDEIEKLLPKYREFLSNLVKLNSLYGQEREAQLLVKSKMKELGLCVQSFQSRADDESINLVAHISGAEGTEYKSLILNAHCDIAPVDAIERWTRPPFSGEIVENVLYGRGAQDDKAGIAIILLVVNVLQNLNIRLKGDLMIQSVVEDETTGNGSKTLVESGYTADGVIICDGTWSERIIYAHLGQMWIDVAIVGEPVAACVENRGVNPIYIGIEFIQKLKCFIENLNDKGQCFEGIEKPFFVNVGSFHSGIWHGAVPASARIEIQVGFSDQYSVDEMHRQIVEIADNTSEMIIIRESFQTNAYKVDRRNQLITKLKAIIEKNSGKDVSVVPVTGHCDMRHFPTPNICLYGPGGGKNPHGIDEYYFLEKMPQVTKNILDFILEWCNEVA